MHTWFLIVHHVVETHNNIHNNRMGDRGMCIMETWLAEHAPEALPLKPVSTLARMPTQGSGNLLQPQRRLPEGSLGLSGYRSVNLKSVPTLTRGNTLNNNNDRMLARLV